MAVDQATLETALELLTLPADAPQIQSLGSQDQHVLSIHRRWVRGPGVVGWGISHKITAGSVSSDLALTVYVEEKKQVDRVSQHRRVPSAVTVPTLKVDVPVDVKPIGRQRLQSYQTRVRPAVPGYSLGQEGGATGTFGCLVRVDGDSDGLYLLSNSHVLASAGTAPVGTHIDQPGPQDNGTTNDEVGQLVKWVSFDFSSGFNNLCDAALSKALDSSLVSASIAEIGIPRGINSNLSIGQTIQKTGRTTGHTTGTIQDVNYRTFMDYVQPNGQIGTAGFRNQVLCSHYSDGGDSGSLILDEQVMAVGLHWCGSPTASVFSPITFVLQAFASEGMNVSLVTTG